MYCSAGKKSWKKPASGTSKTPFRATPACSLYLEALQKSGVPYPLALNVTKQDIVLHEAAHWVWAAGGDFIGPDFRKVDFDQPSAMQGWKGYFSLRPFISPKWLEATSAAGDSFLAHEGAIQMGGPYQVMTDTFNHPELRDQHPISREQHLQPHLPGRYADRPQLPDHAPVGFGG